MRVGLLVLALAAGAARADDALDSVMYHRPELPTPAVVPSFPPGLAAVWLEALRRPEADPRTQAAQAVARAHRLGMPGLASFVPPLTAELTRPTQHPAAGLAAAEALVVLDAKESAPALFAVATGDDHDLRELIDPALARWNFAPARDEWLRRLDRPPHGRGTVLAVRGLAAAGDGRAAARLRDLALDVHLTPAVRLEAAAALGTVRPAGGEADADRLANEHPIGRLLAAHVLRRHAGPEAVRRLHGFVREAPPSAAALAAARLLELDPTLMDPVVASALASPDANVRTLGVEALARRPSADHVRRLADRLSDPHPDVRTRARHILREQAAADLRNVILTDGERVLGGPDWRGREQAAILLAQLDHKPIAGRLVGLLPDARLEVGVAAAWGLRVLAVPDTLPPALAHFRDQTRPLPGGRVPPPDLLDRRLSHLAQLFGDRKYAPADPPLRAMIPPTAQAGHETRAAAVWALGLLHEGTPVAEIARPAAGRLAAVNPMDLEDERVRRMCAVTLGRMNATDGLPTLRRFRTSKTPDLNPVNNACGWALERLTGEKVPPAGTLAVQQINWFLLPTGP